MKEGELWFSTSGPYSGFEKIIGFTLKNEPVEQSFTFEPTPVRWVRLVLNSNYGGQLLQLGEVSLHGQYTGNKSPAEPLKNVVAAEQGGKVVYFSRQYNNSSWAAHNLIDGKLGSNHGFAMSGKDSGEVIFELPAEYRITHLGFNPFTTESSDTWAKSVEVLVSTQGADQGFNSVGRFTLHNWQNIENRNRPLPDQRFEITPVKARFIKLRMLSNYGGSYIELGEFKVYAQTK